MRTTFAIAIVAGFAAAAAAQSTLTSSTDATSSAEIRPDGVRQFSGDVNLAFWNVEPASEGNFATIPFMQFDTAAIKAAFDAEYGVGGWGVVDVKLSLYQAPAGFTSNQATIDFFWGANDPTMTLAGLGGVNYSNALSTIGAEQVVNDYQFNLGAEGTNDQIDLYDGASSGQFSLAADIMAGDLLTIAAESSIGNASWAGAGNIAGLPNPSLIVTAQFIPAPGVAGLFGLAGLAAARRRRA